MDNATKQRLVDDAINGPGSTSVPDTDAKPNDGASSADTSQNAGVDAPIHPAVDIRVDSTYTSTVAHDDGATSEAAQTEPEDVRDTTSVDASGSPDTVIVPASSDSATDSTSDYTAAGTADDAENTANVADVAVPAGEDPTHVGGSDNPSPGVSRETSDDSLPSDHAGDPTDVAASADDLGDRVAADAPVEPTDVPAVPADAGPASSGAETAGGPGADTPPAVLVELHPDQIRANPKNPRQVFDDDELAELSESIKEFGLLQPIVVREQPDGYELVMGERRLRASRLAGIDAIPVIVRQTDDDEMLRDALLENIHRVQLHPLEEAAAYQQLIEEFGVTHEELAKRIKRSRPAISNSIRLLKLPTRVQNRVAAGVLSGSHARALLSLTDPVAQEALATRIVAEGMSVRATEEAVALYSGDDVAPRRAARRKRPTAPALAALAERLSDHFDTRALVQLGRSKGKVIVEFASIDDLERIIAMMAPPLATQRLKAESDDTGPSATRE